MMSGHVLGSAKDAQGRLNMTQQPSFPTVILRRKQVEAMTGYSRSTIYLRISQGLWPRQVKLGARAVGWPDAEVAAVNAARIGGLSEVEIRALVARLEAARRAPELADGLDSRG